MKKATLASAKERLDKAVKDGDLTRRRATAMLEHLGDHLDRFGSGRGFGPPPGPGGFHAPPGEMRR